ncbi:YitT family protein [Spirochaeta cellobiosiphila]|uniref:YitT family protein n=1 Tax=Spirochaeta cellobiosiphila TaxID=504483 RepID=UPI000411258B|nr:YitT family protein [Spirochaeta cellobiosiphila]
MLSFQDIPSLHVYLKRFVYIILGGLVSATALNVFLIPHHFLSGGLSGIALIGNYLWDFSPALILILLNIPIFLLGFLYIDMPFALSSLIGLFSYTLFLHLTKDLQGWLFVPDDILAAIVGGALNGVGMGLVLRNRASFGGTDIIGAIAKRKLSINLGTTLFFFNLIIIISSCFIFEAYKGLYSLIGVFIGSSVIDRMMKGFETRLSLFIVSEKWEDIADFLTVRLGRGATLLKGEGAYKRKETRVIYSVIPGLRLAKIKDGIYDIDPEAFVTVAPSTEIMGYWNKGLRHRYKWVYEKNE